MATIKLDVFGLEEIKDYINPDRINKQLAIAVGETVLQLHMAMKHAVFTRYSPPNDLDRAFKRSSSLVTTGKNFITNGLTYTASIPSLSQFPYTSELGNINPEAVRKGRVYSTTVVRGQVKTVYGKQHFGGFVAGRQAGSYQKFMYERMQQATWISKGVRAPVRVLQAMSLVDMANVVYTYDPQVQQILNNVESIILEKFIP